MKHKFQKIAIFTFLVLVALLALYLTIIFGFMLFQEDGRFSLIEGFIVKFIILILYADMPLLFAAGITSIISFFKRGHIWVPITIRKVKELCMTELNGQRVRLMSITRC